MLRREFIAFAAQAPFADVLPGKGPNLEALLFQIEKSVMTEFPDVVECQIKYDPANKKIPLMFVAFRA